MSADNFYAVIENIDEQSAFYVAHGFMSPLTEDCCYVDGLILHNENVFETRGEALVVAHNKVKEETIVEYGVIELPYSKDKEFCGRCYVCVNERGIIAEDIERCEKCNKPLLDWVVTNSEGTFCRSCNLELEGEKLSKQR